MTTHTHEFGPHQRREINARIRASFDVHVTEFVRRNKAEAVTR